jgi:hypothetical protein
MHLWETEHGLGHKIGPGMLKAIPALVALDVLEPVVGAEIYHSAAALEQLGNHCIGLGVRVADESDVGLTGRVSRVSRVCTL